MPITGPRPVACVIADTDTVSPSWLAELAADAHAVADAPERLVAAGGLAGALAERIPRPGRGRTQELWSALATLGSVDLTVARVIEPHLDAHAILAEADLSPSAPDGVLGVYAAEGPGHRLTARLDGGSEGAQWRLEGSKPWCSLAERVDGFLVTAWAGAQRRLFVVDRAQAQGTLTIADTAWHARGLSEIRSPATIYADVPAQPVGEPGWYLTRPGFAWGGMGVAAVWFGAVVALAGRVTDHARERTPDQIALMHIGHAEAVVHQARSVLSAAAKSVDAGRANEAAGSRLALTVRQVVRTAAEQILTTAAHAMGPAPLVTDEEHARRVADLQVYLRQEHAERDAAALGRIVIEGDAEPPHSGTEAAR